MTKVLDRDEGFEETERKGSDLEIGTDVNYDESNMAVAPAIDFLYAMKKNIVGLEKKEDATEAIRILERFNPETSEEISSEAYNRGRVKPSKAVQLLENEKAQLEEVNRAADGEIEEEYENLQQAYETVEEIYSERFEPMSGSSLANTPQGPYSRDQIEEQ